MKMYEHVLNRLSGADPFRVSVWTPGFGVREAPVLTCDSESLVVERDGESVIFQWANVSAIQLHDS